MNNHCQVTADERRYLHEQDAQAAQETAIEDKSLEIFEDLQRALKKPSQLKGFSLNVRIELTEVDLLVLERLIENSDQTLDAVIEGVAKEQLGIPS